jgi:hypothetical protein
MNIAARFSLSKKPRFIVQERRDKRLKVMLDSLVTLQQGHCFMIKRVSASSASSNVEPAHTQPSTLFPTCDEVVNLIGLLETKGMSISSGKQ